MLLVNEIFHSIQGESTHAGRPCVFVRLTGCNLRCSYCDTPYAYEDGQKMKLNMILEKVAYYKCNLVEITGGEPLLQDETPALCQQLIDNGFEVLIETNGTLKIDSLPKKVKRIMDIKCPGSGELDKTDWDNFKHLRSGDEVKFVITDIDDYIWVKSVLHEKWVPDKVPVLLSPAFKKFDPKSLAEWILRDRLNVRLQLQLHRLIWPETNKSR